MSSIAATEDLAALDAINNAIEEVLSSERWEFDLRRDQITLKPRRTGGTATATADGILFVYTESSAMADSDFDGDFIVRAIPTGSSSYAGTAFRIDRAVVSGATASLRTTTEIGEDMTSVDMEIAYSEYILPDTVRDVVRVSYQEEPISLEQIDPTIELDELFPRPQREHGPPEIACVGGLDVPTYVTASVLDPEETQYPSLRMIIYPVPDSAYVLDYSYYYRHPELTSATSTLDGVPQNVVAKIVDVAAAQMKAYYEKDYNALGLKVDARRSLADMHRRSKGQSADRKVMGNWEGSGSRHRQIGSTLGSRLVNGGI